MAYEITYLYRDDNRKKQSGLLETKAHTLYQASCVFENFRKRNALDVSMVIYNKVEVENVK